MAQRKKEKSISEYDPESPTFLTRGAGPANGHIAAQARARGEETVSLTYHLLPWAQRAALGLKPESH